MADTIKSLLKRLQVMEASDACPKPTGPSRDMLSPKKGSPSTGISKINVKGGNNTNLDAKGKPDHIQGMTDQTPSADNSFKIHNLEFNTGLEVQEAFGDDSEESEDEEPDFGAEDADLDSSLDDELGGEEPPAEEGEEPGEEGEGGDDIEATLDHIDALLRAAMGDDTLSVSIGVNVPKGGEGHKEPDADDLAPEEEPEEIPDATVPEEPGLEDESEFGEDKATMESFLQEFGQKKNSNESFIKQAEDDDKSDDGKDDKADGDDKSDDDSDSEDDDEANEGFEENNYLTLFKRAYRQYK